MELVKRLGGHARVVSTHEGDTYHFEIGRTMFSIDTDDSGNAIKIRET